MAATRLTTPSLDGIVTPEAVVLEIEPAGVGSRLAAAMLDALIGISVLFIAASMVVAATGGDGSSAVTLMAIMVFVVVLVLPVLIQVVMRGRTIGKAAFGLRAVTLEGAPIGARHAVVRTCGGLVDRLLPPGGMTGMLFVLGSARSQTVGDMLAGTIVVNDAGLRGFAAAIWFPVPTGYEAYAASIDPNRMTDEQYTVVRRFLVRNRTLTPEARHALARDLADRVCATLGHQRPVQVHPETFLLCAIARYQRRTFPDYQPAAWTNR